MKSEDFVRWLKARAVIPFGALLMGSVTALVLYLSDQPLGPFLYATLLGAAALLTGLAADWLRFQKCSRALKNLLPGLPDSLEHLADIPLPLDAGLMPLIRSLEKALRSQQTEGDMRYQQLMNYQTMWNHQIKTPIAAMRLLLGQEDTTQSRLVQSELFKVEQYVDMALSYVRLGDRANDFSFAKTSLLETATAAARKYAGQFILKRLELAIDIPENAHFITDRKWLRFVIEQLLSNAVKYSEKGRIRMTYSPKTREFCVRDQGIGISREDLPRVFDLGYTGYNGRVFQQSTGIGLFLCRETCRKLGIGIHIDAALNKGTAVTLKLPPDTLEVE